LGIFSKGMRVCERLRQKRFAAPIMMFTGYADDAIIRRCAVLNARHVLKGAKGWDSLKPLIAELLECKDADARAEAPPPASEIPPATVTVKAKVLAVDDDPRIGQAISIRLAQLGIETLVASNGSEGFALALKERPDVVITDYHMPGGGGDYFIHRLRAASATRQTQVIVLTGGRDRDGQKDYALERDMRCRDGVVAFLTKPLEFDRLLTELRHHIAFPATASGSFTCLLSATT
jgi:CheY-like chemotaxis protein